MFAVRNERIVSESGVYRIVEVVDNRHIHTEQCASHREYSHSGAQVNEASFVCQVACGGEMELLSIDVVELRLTQALWVVVDGLS